MENYKINLGYFTPSYYSTPRSIPGFQGWIEPLNLPVEMKFQHIQVKIWKMTRR